MPDREKVIKAYEDFVNGYECFCTSDDYEYEMHKAVLTLLKEQEAVEPVRDEKTGRFWLCGNCGEYVGFEDNDPSDPNEFDNYCRNCGRKVKWKWQTKR